MTIQMDKILAECRANLQRGRAVGTGTGLFVLLFDEEKRVLLRRRLETESLFQGDLSGKWELVGGGMLLSHFEAVPRGDYQEPLRRTFAQELQEEAGLSLISLPYPLPLFPAFLDREYTYRDQETGIEEEREAVDHAFVTPLMWANVEETAEFHRKLERGELRWFHREDIADIELVGPRMGFLIDNGFLAYELMRP